MPKGRDSEFTPQITTVYVFFFKAHRLLPRRAETYSMRVGAIGPKLDGHGTEDAKLARHLVHPAQGPLLIRVCKLDHQTG